MEGSSYFQYPIKFLKALRMSVTTQRGAPVASSIKLSVKKQSLPFVTSALISPRLPVNIPDADLELLLDRLKVHLTRADIDRCHSRSTTRTLT